VAVDGGIRETEVAKGFHRNVGHGQRFLICINKGFKCGESGCPSGQLIEDDAATREKDYNILFYCQDSRILRS